MSKAVSIAGLKEQLNKPEEYDITFYTHPNNLKLLKEVLPDYTKEKENKYWLMPMSYHCLFGIPVRTNEYMPEFVQRWEFPATPFVDHEATDEVWAKPVRFGKYVDTDQPLFIKVNKSRLYGWFNPWVPFKYNSPIYSI